MKIYNVLLFIFFTCLLIAVSPFLYFYYDYTKSRAELNMTHEHYGKIDFVCHQNRDREGCLEILNDDLSLLVLRHKSNTIASKGEINFRRPVRTYNKLFAKHENVKAVEPEILFKTLLIKRMLNRKNSAEAKDFGYKMKTYIRKYFLEPNKSDYIKILERQDSLLFVQEKEVYKKGTYFENNPKYVVSPYF